MRDADEAQAAEITELYRSLDLSDPFGCGTPAHMTSHSHDPQINYLNVLSVLQPQELPVSEDLHGHQEAPPDDEDDEVGGKNDVQGDCTEPVQTRSADHSPLITTPPCRASSGMSATEAMELYLVSLARRGRG